MIMSNFLRNRKSVREFKKKEVDRESLDKIYEKIDEAKADAEEVNFDLKLYEEGKRIFSSFEGKGGYGGVMIESPHYIGLDFKDGSEESIVRGSYYMEKLITDLNNMDISTCWITVPELEEEERKKIFGQEVGKIKYLLALGYEKLRNPFNPEPFSERIKVEEMVYDNELGRESSIDDLENRGLMDIFYYVRYAPSTKNLQPWRFLLLEDRVELFLEYEELNESQLVDAGIIMYYFDHLARSQAMKNQWRLSVKMEEILVNNKKYRYIGEFKL